jgi:transcriptional regulator with XRE-family HTH domain
MRLGELLGRYREKKNLTKQGLAELLDKSFAAWHSIETGRANPQIGSLIRTGKELDFEVELHFKDSSYVLELNGKTVIANDKPARMKTRRLEKLIENMTPDQIDALCDHGSVITDRAQKKRAKRAAG